MQRTGGVGCHPLELEFPGYCEQPDLGARNQTQVRHESYTPVSPEAFFFFLALGFVQLRVVLLRRPCLKEGEGGTEFWECSTV